jgi:hypothetical protein
LDLRLQYRAAISKTRTTFLPPPPDFHTRIVSMVRKLKHHEQKLLKKVRISCCSPPPHWRIAI